MDWKDTKEVKKKVNEIIKKRPEKSKNDTKSIKNEKKSQKKGRLGKKTKKKVSGFKKFLIITGLLLLECLFCGVIVVSAWCINTMEAYVDLFDVVHAQQNLIEQLVDEKRTEPQAMSIKTLATNTVEDECLIYLGNFKITHYCACQKCCGKNAQGITASGKRVEANKTIAVDPKVIKLGSQVYIDGYGYMEAQDTGSAIKGNVIDVYVPDHDEALKLGVVYKDVYLVK